ncbi:MAG: hypothetical protein KGP28_00245 [Bdellovibrionales bacterium]|nr:hypothetical protein [Bdellovibrionales bacterium]
MLQLLLERATGRRKVASILTSDEGEVISYSWSRSLANRTSHAELQLTHSLFQSGMSGFPLDCTLWVSLRPCAMCSAILLKFSNKIRPTRIRFLQDDPGPAAQNSCLVHGSFLWRHAGHPTLDIGAIQP